MPTIRLLLPRTVQRKLPLVTEFTRVASGSGGRCCPDCGEVMHAMKAAWECPCCGWIEIAQSEATEEKWGGEGARSR